MVIFISRRGCLSVLYNGEFVPDERAWIFEDSETTGTIQLSGKIYCCFENKMTEVCHMTSVIIRYGMIKIDPSEN
jgi:hypothetical protein